MSDDVLLSASPQSTIFGDPVNDVSRALCELEQSLPGPHNGPVAIIRGAVDALRPEVVDADTLRAMPRGSMAVWSNGAGVPWSEPFLTELVSPKETGDARVLYRAPEPPPVAVGDTLTGPGEMRRCPPGTWIRAGDGTYGLIYQHGDDPDSRAVTTPRGVPNWPATVKGLPEAGDAS